MKLKYNWRIILLWILGIILITYDIVIKFENYSTSKKIIEIITNLLILCGFTWLLNRTRKKE